MCSGRVDLSFILRAFSKGMDGVFIGGCWPGECHYITEGNYLALSLVQISKKLLAHIGINPDRLRLEWVSAAEGIRFAEVMNDFSDKVKEAGPLGKGEGIDLGEIKSRLENIENLAPYIKLVERERLRVPLKTVEDYLEFFNSDEFDRLFRELILDKLEICRIMKLLREKPVPIAELAGMPDLNPSEVSNYLNVAARQGLIRFDESKNLIPVSTDEDAKRKSTLITEAKPVSSNKAKIDQIIDKYQGQPESLIHVLMEVQSKNRWLPREVLDKISRKLEVPLSRIMQVASFYKTFSLSPKGRHEVNN